MHRIHVWTLAARPKTLIASISPVLIGTTLAITQGCFHFTTFMMTLATALAIQITTNLANDYFDFVKGADTAERKGFLRMTQSGLVAPASMKRAVIIALITTFLCGCTLIFQGGLAIALLLSLSLALSIMYTGGPFPLAYLGLGELFVLLFFGPIAAMGTYYLQTHALSLDALIAGISPGALSTAILVVNNVRDIDEDRQAHKRTLSVRFGKTFGKVQYLVVILSAFIPPLFFASSHPWAQLALIALFPAIPAIRSMMANEDPRELNPLFAKTGQLLWLYTLLFCIGWML